MGLGITCLIIVALFSAGRAAYLRFSDRRWRKQYSTSEAISDGAWTAVVMGAVVLVFWACGIGVSHLETTACAREAQGYGNLDSDWSFRNGCRIELPGGQLVPSENIRVTSDGEILSEG